MINPLRDIFEEVAATLDITTDEVKTVVMDYFVYVKAKITEVKYKELDSFKGVKTNFLIPGFGKLVIRNRTNRRLECNKNKRDKLKKELNDENNEVPKSDNVV